MAMTIDYLDWVGTRITLRSVSFQIQNPPIRVGTLDLLVGAMTLDRLIGTRTLNHPDPDPFFFFL